MADAPSPPRTPPATTMLASTPAKSTTSYSQRAGSVVTPPPSPPRLAHRPKSASIAAASSWAHLAPRVCDSCLDLHECIASGSWSDVVAASARGRPRSLYAVKVSSQQPSASQVLYHEARILTYLQRCSSLKATYIVPFHGLESLGQTLPSRTSLVMQRAITTLEQEAQVEQSWPDTALAAREPRIGAVRWLRWTRHLARGLAWMHQAGVVHGDIKPSNVLLFPASILRHVLPLDAPSTPPLDPDQDPDDLLPVFADFTSSRHISEPRHARPGDALTPSYASPELLAAYVRASVSPRSSSYSANASPTSSSPTSSSPISASSPTSASASTISDTLPSAEADTWALAVTMLAAALGHDPFAAVAAHSPQQRLYMARQGLQLAMARVDMADARRLPAKGIVSRCLGTETNGVLAPKMDRRWDLERWQDVLEAAEVDSD